MRYRCQIGEVIFQTSIVRESNQWDNFDQDYYFDKYAAEYELEYWSTAVDSRYPL